MSLFSSRTIEKVYPAVVALLVSLGFYFSDLSFPKGEGVLSAGLTMGAIFTAFIATNKSVILTLDTRIMKRLREGKYFGALICYLRAALWSSFIFSILSLVLYFVPGQCIRWICAVWIFNCVHMILTFHRVTSILLIFIDTTKPEKK